MPGQVGEQGNAIGGHEVRSVESVSRRRGMGAQACQSVSEVGALRQRL